MSGYRKFTEEELERARDTNMLDFLSSKGYSFKPSGKGYKCKEHDSLVINGDCHRWYWNSCAMGGHSAIDFCIKIEGMTFPEALHHILGKQLVQTSVPTQPIQESFNSAAADIILPKAEKGKYKRLFGYLCMKRKIDPQIVKELVSRKLLYQDEKGNVVFLGYDKNSKKPQYASIRGTGDKQFRGDIKNSRKEVGFFIGNPNADTLQIFESPIDAMSFATILLMYQNKTVSDILNNYAMLSLGGTSDVALEHYLNNHDNVKKIVTALDNDSAGVLAAEKITGKYKDKYTITHFNYSGKDLNDSLVSAVYHRELNQQTKAVNKR